VTTSAFVVTYPAVNFRFGQGSGKAGSRTADRRRYAGISLALDCITKMPTASYSRLAEDRRLQDFFAPLAEAGRGGGLRRARLAFAAAMEFSIIGTTKVAQILYPGEFTA
jgi:hypothetical protein